MHPTEATQPEGARSPFPSARDGVLCAALTLFTIGYLKFVWPRDFGNYDEGLFLYEAKRLFDGEVMYRDFFEVVTPAAWYVMALLFWLFGVSFDTARLGMAVLHAIIVIIMYAICRRLDVSRSLGAAAGLGHVALCYPAMTIATPHWFGTALILGLLLVAIGPRSASVPLRSVLMGVIIGALIAVQQQKGAIVAVAAAAIILLDGATRTAARPWRARWQQLGRFTAGVAAVVVPLFAFLLVTAGWEPLFDALVRHPLLHYSEYNRTSWGYFSAGSPLWYVHPHIVSRLMFILPIVGLRWLGGMLHGADPARTRALLAQLVVGAAAVASIAYYPNHTHLALVAPIALILIADTVHAALQRGVSRRALPRRSASVLGCVLCLAAGVQAERNQRIRAQFFPHRHDTAFGTIDFRLQNETRLVDTLREQLRGAASRDVFCYAAYPGLYLTAGADNPTPFQLLIPGYNRPDQFARVIEILEARQVQWVVALGWGISRKLAPDPLAWYLRDTYELVPLGPEPQMTFRLLRRKDRRIPAGGL